MLCAFANLVADDVQDHLSHNEEKYPKGDVSQRPSVLQGVRYKYDLHNDVDEQTYSVQEVQHNEQAHRIRRPEPGFALERQDRDRAGEQEHADGGAAQKPDGLSGAVFVELEADKAVD